MAKKLSKRLGLKCATGLVLGAAAASFLAPTSADASLVLVLSEPGFATVTVPDGGTGSIHYLLPYGDFSADITIAKSNSPGNPTGGLISLQSNFLTNTSNHAATLSLSVADVNFAAPNTSDTNLTLKSALGGTFTSSTSSDSIQYTSYADAANHPLTNLDSSPNPAGVTSTGSPLLVSPGGNAEAFSSQTSTTFTRNGLYSLAGLTTITLSPNNSVISFSADTSTGSGIGNGTPEPASAAVIAATGGFLMLRRRRRA
ncbi:MAG: hypothetical protein JWO87_2675 [Phycisphaerales bacterium]|nr:hypothetical protein [Phycisphaerales bacterium]MDB5304718.1 hypothetical protein [Phycisphaerales bacterium]